MELKFRKIEGTDEKHPDYLAEIVTDATALTIGELVRTEFIVRDDNGEKIATIPTWQFLGRLGSNFHTKNLGDAKAIVSDRLFALIRDNLVGAVVGNESPAAD